MSIGTGIFFAALLFGAVYLYRATMDRWDWSKIGRRTFKTFIVIIIVGVLSGAGIYAYYRIENTPARQMDYADLRLGMTKAEVKYVKGQPTEILDDSLDDRAPVKPPPGSLLIVPLSELKAGKRVEDYKFWVYESYQVRVQTDFDPAGNLERIECYSQGFARCPVLFGVADGTLEEGVVSRLGKPTHEEIYPDSGTKKMEYKNLNAWFYLKKTTVYMLGIENFTQTK